MDKIKKFLIILFPFTFCALMAIFLTSCGILEQRTWLQKVRLNEVTRSIFYCPQYIALAEGFFEDEGLKIELTTGEGSEKTMTALLANQADIGLLGTSSVISVIEQGRTNHPVAFAQLTQCDGSFLIGRTPDFNWDDLRGKEVIAGRKGGVPEMVFEHILKKHDLIPEKDVRLLNNIQFNLMSVAFSRDIGDYVALFEPIASRLVAEKHFYSLLSLGLECDPVPYTCYCATQEYIKQNSETIKKFTNAIYEAQKWIQTHDSHEIAKSIIKYFIDFDEELLCGCIEKYKEIGVWTENPTISESEIQTLEEIMKECGELNSEIKYEQIVNNFYAENALNNIN